MANHDTTTLGRRTFAGFDRETVTYERLKPGLLASAEGQFVVIVDEEMIGPFATFPEAESAGYARFGLGPLFIKKIAEQERAIQVTRFLSS